MNDSTPLTLQEFITSQNSVNIQKPTTLNAMQFPEFNTHTQPQRKPDEVCVDVSQDNTATDTSKFCDFLKERVIFNFFS